jgi:hypothetical protein
MHTYCDRCNEPADHPIDVKDDPELADLVRDLGYRSVCGGCYDDLVVEAREAREQQADDRRAEHRAAAHVPIRLEPSDGSDPQETVTEDISESGAQIRVASGLEPGTVVRLSTSKRDAVAVAIVEVVWRDGDALRAGLRLVEASESWSEMVREHLANPQE